jgi:hypothetical protein
MEMRNIDALPEQQSSILSGWIDGGCPMKCCRPEINEPDLVRYK